MHQICSDTSGFPGSRPWARIWVWTVYLGEERSTSRAVESWGGKGKTANNAPVVKPGTPMTTGAQSCWEVVWHKGVIDLSWEEAAGAFMSNFLLSQHLQVDICRWAGKSASATSQGAQVVIRVRTWTWKPFASMLNLRLNLSEMWLSRNVLFERQIAFSGTFPGSSIDSGGET